MKITEKKHPISGHLRLFLPAFCILTFAGCRSFTEHPWTRKTQIDLSNLTYIHPERLTRVRPDQEPQAIRMLESQSHVLLHQFAYSELAKVDKPLKPNKQAYLVRGVSWSRPPWYSLVAMDKKEQTLYVLQYTYNLELYIPGNYQSEAYPLIVLLDEEIVEVVPDAVWGGDWIMGGLSSEYAWREEWKEE